MALTSRTACAMRRWQNVGCPAMAQRAAEALSKSIVRDPETVITIATRFIYAFLFEACCFAEDWLRDVCS